MVLGWGLKPFGFHPEDKLAHMILSFPYVEQLSWDFWDVDHMEIGGFIPS